jgi:hypothetical protein
MSEDMGAPLARPNVSKSGFSSLGESLLADENSIFTEVQSVLPKDKITLPKTEQFSDLLRFILGRWERLILFRSWDSIQYGYIPLQMA